MAPIEFEAADRARRALLASYRLSPREAYVLRSAPVRGLSQTMARRRGGKVTDHRIGTLWLVRDENLTTWSRGCWRAASLPCAAVPARRMPN
jgi:hypothetical protein